MGVTYVFRGGLCLRSSRGSQNEYEYGNVRRGDAPGGGTIERVVSREVAEAIPMSRRRNPLHTEGHHLPVPVRSVNSAMVHVLSNLLYSIP
jgi:hypothetical protein